MTDIEKRAHDIAVAFAAYDAAKDNKINSPDEFADIYQMAYNRILTYLEHENGQ